MRKLNNVYAAKDSSSGKWWWNKCLRSRNRGKRSDANATQKRGNQLELLYSEHDEMAKDILLFIIVVASTKSRC